MTEQRPGWLQRRSAPAAAPDANSRAMRLIAQADQARDAGDWASAAQLYAEGLKIEPAQPAIRVQLGHALKESGQLADAEAAYRRAADEMPEDADARLQLGHAQKLLGQTEAAIRSFGRALEIDPDLVSAREELILLGARCELPGVKDGRVAAAHRLARLSDDVRRALADARDVAEQAIFPPEAYDSFRRRYPITPPPRSCSLAVTVRIDAAGSTPSQLRATLTSLLDQRHCAWTAVVVGAGDTVANHPVASLGLDEGRIRFCEDTGTNGATLHLTAGTILDPEALGWLGFALQRTGAVAIYADHDRYDPDWRLGLIRHSPALQPIADTLDLATNPDPPTVVLTTRGGSNGREALAQALADGPVAHLPRLLSSLPAVAEAEPTDAPASPALPGRILVVIPTRDEVEMLGRAVKTLRADAAQPDQVDVLILDNRSEAAGSAQALAELATLPGVRVQTHDEPFNWSRCNNRGVAGSDAAILVFANNDVEMLTRGWDARLRGWLGRDGVGAVGARLLYPDGGLQHGGILFGGWQNRPSHDGLWQPGREGGPLNRWRRSRPVAAVTGAFLACRREIFEAVGGFDERFAIAYNDIDFCLKVRQRGERVVFAADIEAIHHESKTRGHNDNPEKVAWDDAELADMHRRWGEWLFHDPGYNPQWAAEVNRPYDGLRDLGLSRILAHLDASARPQPWTIPAEPNAEV
ncbi:tetratricopeptide repeat protein [Brevundimonas bacteroides]|uniref:tetratricopeptide repeat protein n=1 Tax=Brevundimonas bacteroides TaxID=74311 RepID=UPI00068DCC68|nr:tetratricopeptide repeat protein [Brevundimonas bacteroides]